jgi:hypothetical protein
VPSTENLQSYWASTGCWLWNSNINFWWYAPFDAPGDSRGGVEEHFGRTPHGRSNLMNFSGICESNSQDRSEMLSRHWHRRIEEPTRLELLQNFNSRT